MVPMLILGVPVGLILILLAPTETLLKRSWVPRFKEAQAILLLLCGSYALAGSVSLLFMGDQKGWMPELLLVRNLWALGIVGIGLVILGKRKYVEAAAQTVVREPNQPEVLVNSQTKLYSDGAIGLAAFSLFGGASGWCDDVQQPMENGTEAGGRHWSDRANCWDRRDSWCRDFDIRSLQGRLRVRDLRVSGDGIFGFPLCHLLAMAPFERA
jgi:hypothetical protein